MTENTFQDSKSIIEMAYSFVLSTIWNNQAQVGVPKTKKQFHEPKRHVITSARVIA